MAIPLSAYGMLGENQTDFLISLLIRMFSGALFFFTTSATLWVLAGQADLAACFLLFQGMSGVGAGGDKYILIHSSLDLNRDHHHLCYCRVEFGVALAQSVPQPPCQALHACSVGAVHSPWDVPAPNPTPPVPWPAPRGLFTCLLIGFCTEGSSRELHLWPKSAWR